MYVFFCYPILKLFTVDIEQSLKLIMYVSTVFNFQGFYVYYFSRSRTITDWNFSATHGISIVPHEKFSVDYLSQKGMKLRKN